MATARAEKTPMRIQNKNRLHSFLLYSKFSLVVLLRATSRSVAKSAYYVELADHRAGGMSEKVMICFYSPTLR